MLKRLAACCGQELVFDSRPREVPFDEAQLAEQPSMSIAERLRSTSNWHRLAGELTGTAAPGLCRRLRRRRLTPPSVRCA